MKGGGALDWSAFVPLAVHPTKVGIAEALRSIDQSDGFIDQVTIG